jgi:hypothetical protein
MEALGQEKYGLLGAFPIGLSTSQAPQGTEILGFSP